MIVDTVILLSCARQKGLLTKLDDPSDFSLSHHMHSGPGTRQLKQLAPESCQWNTASHSRTIGVFKIGVTT
jgi:hypothetical protein